jgi:TATA-binding protein-associated factor Taf7
VPIEEKEEEEDEEDEEEEEDDDDDDEEEEERKIQTEKIVSFLKKLEIFWTGNKWFV